VGVKTILKKLVVDKHSSLFCSSVSEEEKIMTLAPDNPSVEASLRFKVFPTMQAAKKFFH
jgi:hypothetical protein